MIFVEIIKVMRSNSSATQIVAISGFAVRISRLNNDI